MPNPLTKLQTISIGQGCESMLIEKFGIFGHRVCVPVSVSFSHFSRVLWKMVDFAFIASKVHKNQINVWFESHCFGIVVVATAACVWLAFVSAMIVCYLKPKLRARVVLLLVTILVTVKRDGSYCDMALFSLTLLSAFAAMLVLPYALDVCVCVFLSILTPILAGVCIRLASNHQVFFFVGIFHFSNIIIFSPSVLVICTCFTTRMASFIVNKRLFRPFGRPVTSISDTPFFFSSLYLMDATFLFIGLCQLSDAFLKSQLNYINQRTFIFCFRWCLQAHFNVLVFLCVGSRLWSLPFFSFGFHLFEEGKKRLNVLFGGKKKYAEY